jgi:hypothetical protein
MKHKKSKGKEKEWGLMCMRILTVLFVLSFVTLIVVDLNDIKLGGQTKKTGFAGFPDGDLDETFEEEWDLYLQAKSAYENRDLDTLNSISYEQYSLEDYNLSESEEIEFWNMLSNFSNYCDLQMENFVNIERDSKQSIISTNFLINDSMNHSRDAHKSNIYFLRNNTDSLKILMVGCYIGEGFYDNLLNNTELDIKLQSMILDSDNDSITDYSENCTNPYGTCIITDSFLKDTDSDGWWDSTEIEANTDPNNHLSFPYNPLSNELVCNNNLICESGENTTNCALDCECDFGDSRSCGLDVGSCNSGLQQCTSNGTWSSECIAEVPPTNETCNGFDDDCDGNETAYDCEEDCMIDCFEDYDCFVENMRNCTPTKLIVSASINFSGVDIGGTIDYKLFGTFDEKCRYYQEQIDGWYEPSQEVMQSQLDRGDTQEEIDLWAYKGDVMANILKNVKFFSNISVDGVLTDDSFVMPIISYTIDSENPGLNLSLVESYPYQDHLFIVPDVICGDFICDENENCPYDCENTNSSVCNNNLICESGENTTNCALDCECDFGDSRSCGSDVGSCNSGLQQCTSNGTWSSECIAEVPPTNETCDGFDDDCDGEVDEGFDLNNDGEISGDESFDLDNDGYVPNMTSSGIICTGYDSDEYDCDDDDKDINPGEKESYNQLDDDCDGLIDENFNVTEFNYSAERYSLGILKENGSHTYLRETDWATFKLGDYLAKVEVSEVMNGDSNVLLTILSGFNIEKFDSINLRVGKSTTYDFNADGKKDIIISLEEIQNSFKAHLLIKPYQEPLLPVCNNNLVCELEENETNCPNDCKVIEICNNNKICDNEETIQNCPGDCRIEEPVFKEDDLFEEFAPISQGCNDNGVCEEWESKKECPSDCKVDYLKYIKEIGLVTGTILILLTLTFGSAHLKNQINPYGVNKKLRVELTKFVEKGLNMNNIAYYLAGKKYKEKKIKKSLKYAHDFTILKRAVVFYLVQGQKEPEVKKICKKNRWSYRIIKDVFVNIKAQQRKLASATRLHSVRRPGKYNINAFNQKNKK